MWNPNHFRSELRDAGVSTVQARLDIETIWSDLFIPKTRKVIETGHVLMELVCDWVEDFHYTIGHAIVYGGLLCLVLALIP